MTAEDTQKSDKPARASASGASRRRRIVALVLAAVVLAGLSWLAWWYFQARFLVSTSDAFIDAQIVPIAPQEPGRIVALPVETNSRVSGGAVVAQLDPATSEAELAQAKANVAKAETVIASAKANLEQARAAVARQTRAADVTAENARRQADRYRRIVATTENAAVSERQLDDAQA